MTACRGGSRATAGAAEEKKNKDASGGRGKAQKSRLRHALRHSVFSAWNLRPVRAPMRELEKGCDRCQMRFSWTESPRSRGALP